MDNFHQFVSAKSKNQKSSPNQFIKSSQENKQSAHNEDEKYFMQEESEANQQQQQQEQEDNDKKDDSQDSVDPLDAFMNDLEKVTQPKNNKQIYRKKLATKELSQIFNKNESQRLQSSQPIQGQQSHEQPQENLESSQKEGQYQDQQQQFSNIQHFNRSQFHQDEMKEDEAQGQICENDDGDFQEYASSFKNKKTKQNIQTLKPFDFSQVQLEDFQKDFYHQHEDIQRLSQQQVKQYRNQLGIKVMGQNVPKPIISFGHLELDTKIKNIIMRQQFQKPTPIQSQALPVALAGRDMIGVAKTGSGKTLAYVWPMIVHVGRQRQSAKGEGPVGLVLAPTRELCQQIFVETRKYTKKYEMKISCILGGQNKHEQWKQLKSGVDILIASPGRLIQMIRKKATSMSRVTFLVLDEADKMLSLGFQQQIRSIITQTRPDRQTLLFTATMKKSIQFLAFDILQSPVRVLVGEEGAANQDVNQEAVVVENWEEKLQWVRLHLSELLQEGKVLIFCNQRETCEQLNEFTSSSLHFQPMTLHGDKSQYERTIIMNSFKTTSQILIATDIASRGIDVKNIKTVINFECPKTIEAYIHRIGRTGRAGETGRAVSLLEKCQSNVKFAIELIKVFESSGYPVSKELQDLACLDDFYRRKRISSKMGVSFAKGKDASKFLNQILKQQQKGNSKAGLGMQQAQTFYNKGKQKGKSQFVSWTDNVSKFEQNLPKDKNQKTIAQILNDKNLMSEDVSIEQLSRLIKQNKQSKDRQNVSSKLASHFVRSYNEVPGGDQKKSVNKSMKNYKDEITISYRKNGI